MATPAATMTCTPSSALSHQVVNALTPSSSAWAMFRNPSTRRVREKPIVARMRKQAGHDAGNKELQEEHWS